MRCADAFLASILVVPTTTRLDMAGRYRLTIPKGEGGLEESIALIDQVQPVPRNALKVQFGQLSFSKLYELLAILLDNLGVLPPETAAPQDESIEVDDIPF